MKSDLLFHDPESATQPDMQCDLYVRIILGRIVKEWMRKLLS